MGTARKLAADDTRKRLFAAAVQLFSTSGYQATTVDAIARKAGVAKGTFFVHFATKDAVVLELVRRQTTATLDARTAALPDGPAAALRATVMALGEQANLSRELSRAVLASLLESSEVAGDADALFGKVLAEMTADAAAAKASNPDVLARGLMAAYLGAAYHFSINRSTPPMAELLAPLVDTLLEGLHAQPVRARARR